MTTIEDLQKNTIGILGFGQEGQAIAEYLVGHGIKPKIYDAKDLTKWNSTNLTKLKRLDLTPTCGSNFINKALLEANVIFRSPGIRIPDELRQIAIQKNLIITSQTQWFFEHTPAQIIGVTGTKGKGTTASLIYEILTEDAKINSTSRKIFLTGNIGKIQPLEFLDKLTEKDLVVYELSSFQLQNLQQSPSIGICLMVTSDHLDFHEDLTEYHSAKYAISEFQNPSDVLIYNADYKATQKIAQQGTGQKLAITSLLKLKLSTDFGAQILADQELINIRTPNMKATQSVSINTQNRLLRGKHNLENVAAASVVTTLLGVSPEIIQQTINSFKGLNHRLQLVIKKAGIKYYNDSVSTNPDTTIAAINSFTEPLILILGGAVKNLDYTNLTAKIIATPNIKAVIFMGPAGEIIQNLLLENQFAKPIFGPYFNFKEVVNSAQSLAKSGDIILLSPGATSFDMFNNYAERGDEFIKLVSAN